MAKGATLMEASCQKGSWMRRKGWEAQQKCGGKVRKIFDSWLSPHIGCKWQKDMPTAAIIFAVPLEMTAGQTEFLSKICDHRASVIIKC